MNWRPKKSPGELFAQSWAEPRTWLRNFVLSGLLLTLLAACESSQQDVSTKPEQSRKELAHQEYEKNAISTSRAINYFKKICLDQLPDFKKSTAIAKSLGFGYSGPPLKKGPIPKSFSENPPVFIKAGTAGYRIIRGTKFGSLCHLTFVSKDASTTVRSRFEELGFDLDDNGFVIQYRKTDQFAVVIFEQTQIIANDLAEYQVLVTQPQ